MDMDMSINIYNRFLQGHEEAFEEIVDLYREHLIYFLYRYVNSIHTAEDLAEDVFVELLIKPKAFKGKSSLKAFLFAIGRNKAIDYLRKESKLPMISIDSDAICDPDLKDVKTLEDAIIDKEENLLLLNALDRINEGYQKAIYLYYMEELSIKEIALILNKTPKSVENMLYRGKKALQDILCEEVK